MRHILDIALFDLRLSLKEQLTFLIGLLMPAAMMLLLGIAQGGSDDGPIITIDLIDRDRSPLSRQFTDTLRSEMGESFRLCAYDAPVDDCDLPDDITPDTITDRLENTEAFGAIIIPAGFGEALRQGETANLTFQNSNELSAPTLAEQKIEAAVNRLGGEVALARWITDAAAHQLGAYEGRPQARQEAFDALLQQADDAWNRQQPVTVTTEATVEEAETVATGFNQSGPGTAAMFVLIFALNTATSLVYERETGTLQRLYTLPMRRASILAGKLLGSYLFGVAQFTVLLGVGALMGVEWGDNVAGLLLILAIYPLTCTALGMALATVVRTSAQASNIALLMGLTLSPLGGAWWPLEIVGDKMRAIGHLSPVAWVMQAFNELMFYDGGVIDILPMMGVLLGMAALFFAFGTWRFKYE